MSTYRDDPADYARRLDAKLQPDRIRVTMAFAGLYQITYQMLKQMTLDKVREYYCPEIIFDRESTEKGRRDYQQQVLQLAPGKPFRASLLWLVDLDDITLAQADRLEAVYAHRHALAHELIRYVIDPDAEPDVELLVDAVATLRDVHRFWIENEISTGGFFALDGSAFDDIDPDDVKPLQLMMLERCVGAYLDGLVPPEGPAEP